MNSSTPLLKAYEYIIEIHGPQVQYIHVWISGNIHGSLSLFSQNKCIVSPKMLTDWKSWV